MEQGQSTAKMNGAKQTERGQDVEKVSGHGRQRVDRHTAWRTGTAGGHSQRILRPAQASKHNNQQLAGIAAKTAAADDVVLPLAVQLGGGECSRAGSQKGGCRPA